ncbi:hydrogenase maturation protease [Clostridium tetanomorphum]|uniref:hydrogenase maturation protease n=1 Tax=Clostridium tetanomorphum TaxID=1553 RepID=UPI00241DDB79|nr:hydrogenase maturation protease [Clostridium tetanomorphum]
MGNMLMGDDGVGISVGKNIKDKLKGKNIEVIIGETDFEYCISKIKDDDFIFIIDSIISEKECGSITVIPMKDYIYNENLYSQHGCNILTALNLYNKNIEGYIIAIEIEEIKFHFGITKSLEDKLGYISNDIVKIIEKILKFRVL